MAKMKTYFEQWFNNLMSRRSEVISISGTVVGLQNRHLGPRTDYAKLAITYEPWDSFLIDCTAPNIEELRANAYLDYAVFGVLDVLLTAQSYPIRNIHLTIKEADIHPVHANQLAFRWAGRDAARKLLDVLQD